MPTARLPASGPFTAVPTPGVPLALATRLPLLLIGIALIGIMLVGNRPAAAAPPAADSLASDNPAASGQAASEQAESEHAADSRPNIVLILADDLGVSDLACYGRDEHTTPALDRLAADGIRFTDAYCALSICSASRAGLMTGKSPARLHLTSYLPGRPDTPAQRMLNATIHSALPPDEWTVAEGLQLAGYRTGLFGKWHLGGGPSRVANQGFDVNVQPSARGELDDETGDKNEFLITRQAIEFIRQPSDQPYFCYVPHHSPHIRLTATDQALAQHADTFNPLYAASLQSLDRAVDRLLQAVRQWDNGRETIIIFTSDNGGLHVPEGHREPVTHNAPFRAGKGYLYEGGVRIPLLIASTGNRIAGGRVAAAPVSLLDLMPTLLTIAGIDPATTVGPLDGIDLSRFLFDDQPLPNDRSLFWHFPHYTNQGSRPAAAIRQGNWKLLRQWEDGSHELYDLASDLGETTDLAAQHPQVTARLAAELNGWLAAVGAQIPQENRQYDPVAGHRVYGQQDSSRLTADDSAAEIADAWAEWRQAMNQASRGRQATLKSPHAGVLLRAQHARVHGSRLRYEPEPHKNVLGYWTETDDWASWDFTVPQAGTYEVEIQCGAGTGQGGSQVAIHVADQTLTWTVPETGHFQRMVFLPLGQVELTAGQQRLEVRPISKAAAAIMDIRQIQLRPIDQADAP